MNDLIPKMINLKGREKFTRVLAGAPETRGMKSGYVCLQPGQEVGVHKSEAREESVVILEGSADIFIDGKLALVAHADHLIYIPPETVHNIKNSSEKILRYVYVTAPSG